MGRLGRSYTSSATFGTTLPEWSACAPEASAPGRLATAWSNAAMLVPRSHAIGRSLLAAWLVSWVWAPPAQGGSAGPMPGGSGVPARGAYGAEPTCTVCHDGFSLNPDGEGAVAIQGLPKRYSLGARYPLRIAARHGAAEVQRFGFQLTAVGVSGEGAGEFGLTDPERTQVVIDPSSARSYLEHTLAGTAPASAGEAAWSFEWIAPRADRGEVAFFAVVNAANQDGSKAGDRIYSTSPAPLAVVSGPVVPEGEPR